MRGKLRIDIYQPKPIQRALMSELTCEVTELPTGDYAWTSEGNLSVGIESKTSTDLVTSFVNGRLADQISRLIETYDVPILLVTGSVTTSLTGHILTEADIDSYRPCKETTMFTIMTSTKFLKVNFQRSALANYLVSAQSAGLIIDINGAGPLPRETLEAQRVVQLVRYWDKPDHKGRGNRKYSLNLAGYTDYDTKLAILCSLPGINETLAKRLLEQFGSIKDVISRLDTEDLCQVKGIGSGKLAELRRVLS